ncbi:MAG: histidine phosphatase family protein [Anaerolineales bacterium]|nr:histidine phosphatase family protein [Anaerolineales bacterium]MCX7608516.1 histidine phosphatase family protein [Anaerolineales bacterium]MDW8227568.1 histidine phosphatase family protein [Anaerolineales bacterium]
MPTLLLIRHGENDYFKSNKMPGRSPGIHLNARGREQAAALAEALGRLALTAIYSSPLERALETAQPLADALGLQVQTSPDLMDTDVGAWAGRSWKMLRRTKAWRVIQETPSQFRFPGGESFVECQARIVATLQEIVNTHGNDALVAVVFHADPIKLAVAHFLGLPLDSFQRLSVAPGSVSVLHVETGRAQLAALNLIPPFRPEAYFPPAHPDPKGRH